MPRTRSKPGNTTSAPPKTKTALKTLDAPVESPPQLVVLPKDASPDARIVTINTTRYFIDPIKGFYEFTRISAPKSTPRSWLLAPDSSEEDKDSNGYLLSNASLLLATPIDPLFLLLPSLASDITSSSTEYLASSDYLDKLSQSSPHLANILHTGILPSILANRTEAVSDCMDMGDEKMYALSLPKLVAEIVHKARRMAETPLPKSMEERFVKGALDVPVLNVRREETGLSVHGAATTEGAEVEGDESQQSSSVSKEGETSQESTTSTQTAATSISSPDEKDKDSEITPLLRLRTSLDFLLKSYIPSSLTPLLEPLISKSIDWTPLTLHLERIAKLKKEAQALRSIGENFSRKRSALEDGEDEGREAMKKRKKEEEEKRKKSVSQGVRKLAKVDRSGMKSLSSFFGKN